HRHFLPFQRRLADSREARIGAQANEEIITQSGVREERFEALDSHSGGPWARWYKSYGYAADCIPRISRLIPAGHRADCRRKGRLMVSMLRRAIGRISVYDIGAVVPDAPANPKTRT